jgi:hypothetical protein
MPRPVGHERTLAAGGGMSSCLFILLLAIRKSRVVLYVRARVSGELKLWSTTITS